MNSHKEGSPESADIALVGEALGAAEVRYGRPFIGDSGQLLNNLLASAGITRSQCFITNVLSFHPDKNNLDPYIKFGSKAPKLVAQDIINHEIERLRFELEACSTNLIIACGKLALWALTGQLSITKLRGSILDCTLVKGKKVLPIVHPASVLQGDYFGRYYILFDLAKAKRILRDGYEKPKRNMQINPTFEQAVQYLKECYQYPEVGCDIEVAFIKDSPQAELSHIAFAKTKSDVMCIPFVERGESKYHPEQEVVLMEKIAKLLRNKRVTKVGQNFMFDANFLLRRYGIITENVKDTLIAEAIIHSDFPKSLAFLVSIYTDEPYYKDDGKMHKGTDDEAIFREYNCRDAALCMEIHPIQIAALEKWDMLFYYKHKLSLIEPLLYMQEHGLAMDVELREALKDKCTEDLAQIQSELNEIVGYELNPRSSKQLQTYFYIEKGIKPYLKKGRPTCDEDAMKRLENTKGLKEAKLINKYRSIATKKSTFYSGMLDEDGRLRCSFNPVGAESRLSSSKTIFGTGMNMQNQPPDMKRCMIADPGYLIVNVDLAQAENRVVAYIWQISEMIAAFDNGVDIHSKTAALLLHKDPSEISKEKGSTQIGGGKYSERDLGKRANHAFNYGLGWNSFAVKNEVSPQEAKFVREQYLKVYPELLAGHARTRNEVKARGELVNLLGRKRKFYGRHNDDLWRIAYSFIPQSTIGDHMNLRGVAYMYYHDEEARAKANLVNQVHDSIVFLFPFKAGLRAFCDCVIELKRSLETPIDHEFGTFYLPMDLSFGLNLGKRNEENPTGIMEYGSDEYKTSTQLAERIQEFYEELRTA